MENDKKECRAYFLERSVYKKLFAKIQEKYAGIGHFGGTFLLDDLTKEEKKSSLAVFFRKIFPGRKMCGSRQNKWKRHCKAAASAISPGKKFWSFIQEEHCL